MMEDFLANRPAMNGVTHPLKDSQKSEFRPLFSMEPAQPALAANATGQEPSSSIPAEEPDIELVREGDRITRIIVTCQCCRRIELDCEY